MLLFCNRVGIALELGFRVAGENIRAFQISGKSGRALGTAFGTVPRACSLPNNNSSLRELVTPIDFKGWGSQWS
jgi:hypothetical protein